VGLDIDQRAVRKLALTGDGAFTGDAWALNASLAVPAAGVVPRLVADGKPVRWAIYAMSSADSDAEQVVDVGTSLSTCMVKISRTASSEGKPLVRTLVATAGTILAKDVAEEDVSEGDVFVLAIPAITVDTATFLWIVPTSGFSRVLEDGVSP
jgi:hypothetical protein